MTMQSECWEVTIQELRLIFKYWDVCSTCADVLFPMFCLVFYTGVEEWRLDNQEHQLGQTRRAVQVWSAECLWKRRDWSILVSGECNINIWSRKWPSFDYGFFWLSLKSCGFLVHVCLTCDIKFQKEKP